MASVITATVANGLTQSADNSGVLQLASGTGNLVTVPSVTGTAMVSGNMPAFSAYGTALTSVSNVTFTKLTYATEEFDTNNNYSSSRFTPTVAGYYLITGSSTGTTSGGAGINIFKNGNSFKTGTLMAGNATDGSYLVASALIYFNGSTDYVELYGYQRTGGTISMGSNSQDFAFQGVLVRTA